MAFISSFTVHVPCARHHTCLLSLAAFPFCTPQTEVALRAAETTFALSMKPQGHPHICKSGLTLWNFSFHQHTNPLLFPANSFIFPLAWCYDVFKLNPTVASSSPSTPQCYLLVSCAMHKCFSCPSSLLPVPLGIHTRLELSVVFAILLTIIAVKADVNQLGVCLHWKLSTGPRLTRHLPQPRLWSLLTRETLRMLCICTTAKPSFIPSRYIGPGKVSGCCRLAHWEIFQAQILILSGQIAICVDRQLSGIQTCYLSWQHHGVDVGTCPWRMLGNLANQQVLPTFSFLRGRSPPRACTWEDMS